MLIAQAIKTFADARPPGIYKPDYIDALYAFYHETKPDSVICPPTPEWKRSSELDLNGEAVPEEDDDGVPLAPGHVCNSLEVYYILSLISDVYNMYLFLLGCLESFSFVVSVHEDK